jgi:hypothetical protein
VPFPYFHVLNVLLVVDLLLVSYGLVDLDFHPALTVIIYLIVCVAFLGLKQERRHPYPQPHTPRPNPSSVQAPSPSCTQRPCQRPTVPLSDTTASAPSQQVAVAMSDPFGDDDIDFDLEAMLSGAYKNAVACLRDQRTTDGDDLGELINPILSDNARFTIDIRPYPVSVHGDHAKSAVELTPPHEVTTMSSYTTSSTKMAGSV